MNDVQKILFWGTYDIGKPRVRLLLKGARTAGFEVIECHKDIWQGIQDKSQIHGVFYKLRLLISWLLAYPRLILEYIRAPQHDVVVVPYMGQFDVLVLYPFAWLRKKPILWDVFISLYDTVIYDRKLFAKRSFKAYLLYAVEWMACRLASTIVLDTQSHAEYFARLFQLDSHRVQHIFVGAESEFFLKKRLT